MAWPRRGYRGLYRYGESFSSQGLWGQAAALVGPEITERPTPESLGSFLEVPALLTLEVFGVTKRARSATSSISLVKEFIPSHLIPVIPTAGGEASVAAAQAADRVRQGGRQNEFSLLGPTRLAGPPKHKTQNTHLFR